MLRLADVWTCDPIFQFWPCFGRSVDFPASLAGIAKEQYNVCQSPALPVLESIIRHNDVQFPFVVFPDCVFVLGSTLLMLFLSVPVQYLYMIIIEVIRSLHLANSIMRKRGYFRLPGHLFDTPVRVSFLFTFPTEPALACPLPFNNSRVMLRLKQFLTSMSVYHTGYVSLGCPVWVTAQVWTTG